MLEGIDSAEWERRVADVAVSQTDWVAVAVCECVQGLERRVVVWLPDSWWGENLPVDTYTAVPAISRCSTHLIIVYPAPPGDWYTHSSDSSHSTTTDTTDDKDETTEGRRL